MADVKKEARNLALPLLAAGAVLLGGRTPAVAAETENGNTADGNGTIQAQGPATLHAALVRAAGDKSFADKLLNDPEQFRGEYNLTDGQIAKLRASKEWSGSAEPRLQDADYCC